jgi:uncharacterized membrane protein
MKKYLKLLLVLLGIILMIPNLNLVLAQDIVNPYEKIDDSGQALIIQEDKLENNIFHAQIIEILEEKVKINKKGEEIKQQNLKLKGLNSNFKNQELIFYGINDVEVVLNQTYKVGDKVIVSYNEYPGEDNVYYIIDSVRSGYIYLLVFIFIFIIILIGRWKGFRAIISLLITFIIILKFILPAILNAYSPILVGIGGGFIILFFTVYITEGINRKSHVAVFSILISLLVTGFLAVIFSNLMKLSGMSEDSAYLVNLIDQSINFKGLLFAGVIIGSLGVLNDMVISQVSAVREIKFINENLSDKDIFKRAYRIGISHVSSMTNTLFLAYAGSSLTILLLFFIGASSFNDVLNNYLISTEIFRSLVGAIGIVLSMPISTWLAVYYLKVKE